MSRRPMSPGDAVWFHMDGPANTAMITSILVTRTPLDFEQVKRVYARRLVRFRRFSERVVEVGLPYPTPHWEPMPGFAIEQQMHHVALPAPGDDAALTELISDLASTPRPTGAHLGLIVSLAAAYLVVTELVKRPLAWYLKLGA